MAHDSTHYIYKGKKICTLDKMFSLYKEHGSVWIVAQLIGGSAQTIHTALSNFNINKVRDKETPEIVDFIKENYIEYKNNHKTKDIAKRFNVSEIFISRIAKRLKLTSDIKLELSKELKDKKSKTSSLNAKKYLENNPHPKGMLNKKHSKDTLQKLSDISTERWKDKNSVFNSDEFRQKASDRMSKWQNSRVDIHKNYTRGKQGYYLTKDGKSIFMRSSWELNYACYLDYLIYLGTIYKWEYEVDVFWFDKIKRGVRSYKPDFKVFDFEGNFIYHEVKGWMDNKSKTKLNRMRIYHPSIKILVIGQKEYNLIKKEYSEILENWDKFLKINN
jgi:hypothetical protein